MADLSSSHMPYLATKHFRRKSLKLFNLHPPPKRLVFMSNCQLLVCTSNSCLQVVVAGDATFQDVKSEIARVYQGISSASLDERYARCFCLISVMSRMLSCCKHA